MKGLLGNSFYQEFGVWRMGKGKCIICGERLVTDSEQLCGWCREPELEDLLKALLEEVDSQLKQNPRIDVKENPSFSLVADLGILGIRHPLLASFSKVIARLIVEGGKGVRKLSVSRLYYGQRNILPFLLLLNDFGIITYNEDRQEVEIPESSPLLKVKYEIEVEPRRNPAAAFILGYVTLNAILQTLKIIKERRLSYGEGVTGLYSITRDPLTGRVRVTMPKSYMATIAFVMGSWAHGFKEFSELDLHKFMAQRGVTGKEFNYVLGTLSCAFATPHALYEKISVEHLGRIPIHRFRLNQEYIRLYERLRQRVRYR